MKNSKKRTLLREAGYTPVTNNDGSLVLPCIVGHPRIAGATSIRDAWKHYLKDPARGQFRRRVEAPTFAKELQKQLFRAFGIIPKGKPDEPVS